jgi:asparagine synthase (glutamine-hydrolysing)
LYSGIRALQPGEMLEARLETKGVTWKTGSYHRWSITPDPSLTLDQATDKADALLTAAVRAQLESDVPLGALLSGGIDSSLVSVAAQEALADGLRTYNVSFSEKDYDETWSALAVADCIRSRHKTLDMESASGSWELITGLLLHAGQPFADTSIFAVNAICRLMREHVTVALSGDGGDEGFGGYSVYWRIARIARWQKLPNVIWRGTSLGLRPFARLGAVSDQLPRRLDELVSSDGTSVIQSMFCWIPEKEHRLLCRDKDLLPVRRLFETQWEHRLPVRVSRVERLSAHLTEINTRLTLPNDFLFKVDTASMKEGLEVRVPMLDEDLFALGLSLPHRLKVNGRSCKRVLRAIAKRKLPRAVATKPKHGFGIPIDKWVDEDFKASLRDVLLGSSSRLPEFFFPEVYKPIIEAFSDGRCCPGVARGSLYQLAIMLLAVQLTLDQLHNARLTRNYF